MARALEALERSGLDPVLMMPGLMIDSIHANCGRDYRRMPEVFREVLRQRRAGARGIIGAMIESNIEAGAQALGGSPAALVHGPSITDLCIDWATTEQLVREAAAP